MVVRAHFLCVLSPGCLVHDEDDDDDGDARKRQCPFLKMRKIVRAKQKREGLVFHRVETYYGLNMNVAQNCLTSTSYQLFAHLYCKYCHNLYDFLFACSKAIFKRSLSLFP